MLYQALECKFYNPTESNKYRSNCGWWNDLFASQLAWIPSATSLADLPDKGITREDLRSVARAEIKRALDSGMSIAELKEEVPYQYLSLVDEVAASI